MKSPHAFGHLLNVSYSVEPPAPVEKIFKLHAGHAMKPEKPAHISILTPKPSVVKEAVTLPVVPLNQA